MHLPVRRVSALVAFGLAALAFGSGAEGEIVYTLSDGNPADTVVITDGGTGQITFQNVVVGNFTISGTVDGPPLGPDVGPGFVSMTQNTVNVASSGGGTLTLTLADTGVVLSTPLATGLLTSNISNSRFGEGPSPPPAGSNFTFQSWLNTANTITPGGPTPGLQGPFTTAPIANQASTLVPIPGAPFALINQLVLKATGSVSLADTGTTALQANAVPEPGSFTLVGTATLPLIGVAVWLRRRVRG